MHLRHTRARACPSLSSHPSTAATAANTSTSCIRVYEQRMSPHNLRSLSWEPDASIFPLVEKLTESTAC
eukprot:417906-Prymnesium_polylepis.2